MNYNKDLTGDKVRDAYVTSSYIDFQSRITKNLYATLGSRFDEHSLAGNEDSHRADLSLSF